MTDWLRYSIIPTLMILLFGIFIMVLTARACIIGAPSGGQAPVIDSNKISHVVIVMEENQAYSSVYPQPSLPYFNSLANTGGLATFYYGNVHPSMGNYFWLTAGQLISSSDAYDPGAGGNTSDNVVRRLLLNGKTWKEYCENRPSVGYIGNDVYPFIQHHCPLGYFSDVRGSGAQLNNLVGFPQFTTDLNANNLPSYSFIAPNQLNNAHDGSLATADAWLTTNIKPLVDNQLVMQNTILMVLFDESVSGDTVNGGGHIYWSVTGPQVNPGYQSIFNFYPQQSTLREALEALGIPFNVGGAATAPSMAEFFNSNFAATGAEGVAFNYKITGTNTPTSFNATSLPGGLSVNTSSGLISGTPSVGSAGLYSVQMSATNGFGTGLQALALTIGGGSLAPGFYVATTGNDSNAGTLNSPFATLTRCQTAMQASGTNKTCYVRSGSYTPAVITNCDGGSNTCLLDLQHAADGVTYQYYPPDGYNSANITGGSNAVGNGAYTCVAVHAHNVTFNGIHIHNCQYAIFRTTGGSIDSLLVRNSELDNTFIGLQAFSSGAVSCSGCSNAMVSHNYIHDMGTTAVSFANVNGTVTNMTVDGNYIQTTCKAISDCGAVYLVEPTNMQTSTGTRWTNNYIRDGNVTAGVHSNSGQAFYTDDCVSNVVISGNVITGRNGSNTMNVIHGGKNVSMVNNLVDISTFQEKIAAFQTSSINIVCPDASMSGNQIENNIIIGSGPGLGYAVLSGTPPNIPTIINNDYFPYVDGAIISTGAYSDQNRSAQDPLLTNWEYNIGGTSAVLSSPVSFEDICRTWGPPGFVVPHTGTVPSSPHP